MRDNRVAQALRNYYLLVTFCFCQYHFGVAAVFAGDVVATVALHCRGYEVSDVVHTGSVLLHTKYVMEYNM